MFQNKKWLINKNHYIFKIFQHSKKYFPTKATENDLKISISPTVSYWNLTSDIAVEILLATFHASKIPLSPGTRCGVNIL